MGQKNNNQQDPLEFLKTFKGKKVHIHIEGKFGDAKKRGELVDYEIYKALILDDYKIEVDESGRVFLRCPPFATEFVKTESRSPYCKPVFP